MMVKPADLHARADVVLMASLRDWYVCAVDTRQPHVAHARRGNRLAAR